MAVGPDPDDLLVCAGLGSPGSSQRWLRPGPVHTTMPAAAMR